MATFGSNLDHLYASTPERGVLRNNLPSTYATIAALETAKRFQRVSEDLSDKEKDLFKRFINAQEVQVKTYLFLILGPFTDTALLTDNIHDVVIRQAKAFVGKTMRATFALYPYIEDMVKFTVEFIDKFSSRTITLNNLA
jgi:hypothetical protein